MVLSKKEILNRLQKKEIIFDPGLDAFQIQPNSVDLRLGQSFYIPLTWKYNEKGRVAVNADYLDRQKVEEYFKLVKLSPGQYFEILPNEFIIVSTMEKINLACGDLSGMLLPRSSTLRRGLQIQSGIIDCRYHGQLTIPLVNNSQQIIKLYPGERICQIQFFQLSSELGETEANMHGKQEAKYSGSTPYGLEAKSDDATEIDLIRAGKLDELKATFKT